MKELEDENKILKEKYEKINEEYEKIKNKNKEEIKLLNDEIKKLKDENIQINKLFIEEKNKLLEDNKNYKEKLKDIEKLEEYKIENERLNKEIQNIKLEVNYNNIIISIIEYK